MHNLVIDSVPRGADIEPATNFYQGVLKFAWLEITQHCNLRCLHCYTSSSPARKHNSIGWKKVIRDVYDTGCRQIQFIGGEPLSHPDIRDYIDLTTDLGFDFVEVFTNAALLTRDVSSFLAKHGVHVATSFYSTASASHEAVTLTKGSFEQTVEGIRAACDAGLPLRVGVICAADDGETIDRKVEFLEALGVNRAMIRVDNVRPVGRGSKMTPYVSQFETLCGACWQGKLVISYDGNCYPCVMARNTVVGNIHDHSIAELVSGKALNEFRVSYGQEVVASRKARAEAEVHRLTVSEDDECGPNCLPSGPCGPNCSPQCPPPCNPDNCVPVNPACAPDDSCEPSTCVPDLCAPWKGS